jgi:hypothetical protein
MAEKPGARQDFHRWVGICKKRPGAARLLHPGNLFATFQSVYSRACMYYSFVRVSELYIQTDKSQFLVICVRSSGSVPLLLPARNKVELCTHCARLKVRMPSNRDLPQSGNIARYQKK